MREDITHKVLSKLHTEVSCCIGKWTKNGKDIPTHSSVNWVKFEMLEGIGPTKEVPSNFLP
jgi:hypothetical protein